MTEKLWILLLSLAQSSKTNHNFEKQNTKFNLKNVIFSKRIHTKFKVQHVSSKVGESLRRRIQWPRRESYTVHNFNLNLGELWQDPTSSHTLKQDNSYRMLSCKI